MKNDLSCEVVRDLLPSYLDGVASGETKAAVERHMEECPDCRGVGALCHEGGWCVYVECLDCGAHTAYVEYANPEEQEEAERRSAALWNMGKVIHMRPGE